MDDDAKPLSAEEADLMAWYGITRTPAYRYHYGAWRYSSLAHALAQAKRDAVSHPSAKGTSDGQKPA